ncbi:isopenicillin N synthase family oxygenase [Marinicella sp. S1101]|uniref:isopenicillin N synthase family dioxygenase n=1 Tax=Marinicella marina TaxID=2996016 RepID=UPI002260E7DD|nr:2OG-Fe(II) oxygenase family protein [Marinicella marina]MCX7554508.1 isopenicillin N synthase family oxygenase [Marinicella marina]MDJ1140659.1 2-oxoglutarate and iron-dependent oxygenase domain-containing protein [Marinicella marina]
MTTNTRQVPELNLEDYIAGTDLEKQRFVDNFFAGLKDYGFIVLNPYQFDFALVDECYAVFKSFFQLPLATKQNYNIHDGGKRGYVPRLQEHAKNSTNPDLKEFWHVGREVNSDHHLAKEYPNNLWPNEIPGFKQKTYALYEQLDQTALVMFRSLATALDVPKDYFEKLTHDGNSILRAIHYPPMKDFELPGSVRAAAHEDINLITLLVGATDSGLELLDRDGQWLAVDSTPGQIVVDSGDMLSRIANEVIPATTHRVVNPSDDTSDRYSMPFFCHPHPDAVLSCIPSCEGQGAKYPDITARDFLNQRLKEIGLS